MKLPVMNVICHGIKQSEVEMEGKKYSSTTFYLPAELADNAAGKTLGSVRLAFPVAQNCQSLPPPKSQVRALLRVCKGEHKRPRNHPANRRAQAHGGR